MTVTFTSLFPRRLLAATAAALAMSASPMAQAITAAQALDAVHHNGLHAPHDLKKKHGLWATKAVSAEGQRHYVLIDDASGAVTSFRRADLGARLPGARQVAEHLHSLGWGVVKDVDLDDGLWEAKVRQQRGGPKVKVVLHPVTLQVLNGVSPSGHRHGQTGGGHEAGRGMSAARVVQQLQAAGYRNIHDVEFDEGRWEAEAINPAGQHVELHLNAVTGAIEREKQD